MYDRFLLRAWIHIPLHKFVEHRFKILNSLTLRNSVIWPPTEMNLSQIMRGSILSLSLKHPFFKEWRFFIVICHWDFYKFLILIVRWNAILSICILIWPKLVALCPSILLRFTSTNYHSDIVFNNHLPEVICCLG